MTAAGSWGGGFLYPPPDAVPGSLAAGRHQEPSSAAGGTWAFAGGLCAAPTRAEGKGRARGKLRKEEADNQGEGVAGGPAEDGEPGGGSPLFAAFGSTLYAFLYSVLDLEMFPFPLIDQLRAARLSSALPLARSIFLHFLYKEPGRGARRAGEI